MSRVCVKIKVVRTILHRVSKTHGMWAAFCWKCKFALENNRQSETQQRATAAITWMMQVIIYLTAASLPHAYVHVKLSFKTVPYLDWILYDR